MKSRRQFLKVAGLSAFALGSYSAVPNMLHAATTSFSGAPKKSDVQWALVIDTEKMADPLLAQATITACHSEHNVPNIKGNQEIKWLWTDDYESTFPDDMNPHLAEEIKGRQYLLLCNHCQNPPCVRVCPTKATYKREDGIVAMDYHRCIGCRFCMAGCPYGARSFNFSDPKPHVEKLNPNFPARMRGVVEKCTLCSERLTQEQLRAGAVPACVEVSDGGILFGNLNDPNSDVCQALKERYSIRRKPNLGTQPNVYYLL